MEKFRKSSVEVIQQLILLVVLILFVAFVRDFIATHLGRALLELIIFALCLLAFVLIRGERELSEARENLLEVIDHTYLSGKTLRNVIESGFFAHFSEAGDKDYIHQILLPLVVAIAVGPKSKPVIMDFDENKDLIFRNRYRYIQLQARSTDPDSSTWLRLCYAPNYNAGDTRFYITNLWDFTTPVAEFNALCRQKMQNPETSYVLGEIVSAYWLWTSANHSRHNFEDTGYDAKTFGLPAVFRRDLEGPLHELGEELEKIHHTELIPEITK